MTPEVLSRAPGRPREYDRDAALAALLGVFRAKGYEAASLDELTGAAGLSRSSFYGCFKSKRGALLCALERYAQDGVVRLREASRGQDGVQGKAAAEARVGLAIDALFDAEASEKGCFLGDIAAELGARDTDVTAIMRDHSARLERLMADLAAPLVGEEEAPGRARAVFALSLGAGLLRKSGAPIRDLDALKREARRMLGAG